MHSKYMLKGLDLGFEKLLDRDSRKAVSESAQTRHLPFKQSGVPQPSWGGSTETISSLPAKHAPGFTVSSYLLMKLLGK